MHSISVIIPTWNRADTIIRALDSVDVQNRPADEIIVVDDGSTDNTCAIIKQQYPQVKLLKQDNRGVSSARNSGIKSATGNWICFLDSDDTWQPHKLEKQRDALTKQPDFLVCHTNETWFRNGKQVKQLKKHKKQGGYIFQYCLPLCVISPSSVMIHRDIFDTVGLFDESMPACEDYDMWLRICAFFPVLYIEEKLITKYGGHDDQLSQKYWGMDRFRIHALEKIIKDDSLPEINRNAAICMLHEKINIYISGAKKHRNNEHVAHFQSLLDKYKLKDAYSRISF